MSEEQAELSAITLWRPWSDAIARGPKRVENRTWPPPSTIIGKVVAIHAGKKYDAGNWPMPDFSPPSKERSPIGIVGVARIVGAVASPVNYHVASGIHQQRILDALDDEWFAGPWGWVLQDVVAIEPVECQGAMGLWRVPPSIREEVFARVAKARER